MADSAVTKLIELIRICKGPVQPKINTVTAFTHVAPGKLGPRETEVLKTTIIYRVLKAFHLMLSSLGAT